jgi:hypothetical protein
MEALKIWDEENSLFVVKILRVSDLFVVPTTSLVLQGGKRRGDIPNLVIIYVSIYLLFI